ncbi:MAG: DUF7005 family protein [Thermoanaerobaculia bacterium]
MTMSLQASTLAGLGASSAETAELLAYNQNVFDLGSLGTETRFPLSDEPFVAFWEEVEREARERGAFAVLREKLPQLRFPIRAGISETEGYRAATRRGVAVESIAEATGLELERPEAVEVVLHTSPAGRIPLVIGRRRPEFVAVLRALTRKNEPAPVPDAQGALMVSGYNNWARIRALGGDFRSLQERKELYQDRFILLSNGPYSAVPAGELGLGEEEWREVSLVLRRDHECAHYLTRRLFGSMRNNLLDELIADYAGLVGATGRFRAGWFLRFVGLEDYPRYREGGRLDLYRGKPPLSDGAFRVLQSLVKAAAENLERFDAMDTPGPRDATGSAVRIAALASLRLEDLAAEGAPERLGGLVATLGERLGSA